MLKKKNLFLVITAVIGILCNACNQSENFIEKDYSMFIDNKDVKANDNDIKNKDTELNNASSSEEALPWNWPADMIFSGVKSEMRDFKLGNLGSNIKVNASASSLICPDMQNNIIYHMSYNDRFIYKYENEKDTLLIDKQAHNLQLWENKLYFINIKKTDFYASGPIYSYDLNTKKLELVLDKNIALFYIDNFGVYYSELDDSGQLSVSLLDFNNKISSLNHKWVVSYNEYLITILDGYLSLINRFTNETTKIMSFEDSSQIIPTLHIYENKLIFAVEYYVYVLDLTTGDKNCYNAKLVDPYMEKVTDMIIMNDTIYISVGTSDLVKIDLNNDEVFKYISLHHLNTNKFYSYLQTNGERLFASVFNYDHVTHNVKVIGFDEIFFPDEGGNVLTRKEFGI